MPTYDFRCPNGHDFEKFYRKISDAVSELACPECGAVAQRRVSGGAGLVFKGSGFYLTDYGKDAHRKPAPGAAGKSEPKGAAGTGDSGSESKGEAAGGAPAAPDSRSKAPPPEPASPKGGTGPTGSGAE